MSRTMKSCTLLILISSVAASCAAFSWGRVFGRPDLAEGPARAMEEGVASSVPGHAEKMHPFAHSKKETSRTYHKAISSHDHLLPSVEQPLPDEAAVVTGTQNSGASTVSKQISAPVPVTAAHNHASTIKAYQMYHTNKNSRHVPEVGRQADPEPNHVGDVYPTIAKEIADISKQIGPVRQEPNPEVSANKAAEHEHQAHPLSSSDNHTTLTKGIEQAIAGLTSVYNTLRASNETDQEVPGKSAEKEPVVKNETQAIIPPASETPMLHLSDREEAQEKNIASSPLVSPSPGNGEQLNATTAPQNSTETDSIAASSADKDDDFTGRSNGGVSTFALLGGVALIAAVGVFIVGYSQNHDTAAPSTPLYPPRGPAYV